MLVNALRGHLAEFGVIAGHGIGNVKSLLIKFNDTRDKLPELASEVIDALTRRLSDLQGEIQVLDKQMRLGRPIRIAGLAEAAGGPAFSVCAGLLHYAVVQRAEEAAAGRGTRASEKGYFGRFGAWLKENF